METKIKDDNNYTKLSTGNPSVYLLNLRDTGRGALRKKDFGCSYNSTRPNKTIMLMGATGSGKSTLINGMINYILGVEWSDSLRFKLIDEQTNKTQAESQTSDVTAYQIHYQNDFQVPYSVTIIDTPGFGDTRGIAQDKEITEKIRKFFSEKYGIVSIDAVCFVVQSALARLTHTQKYIFEAILSIFGKDIANNITIMITFADGQKPPVLEAIKAADIPCGKKEDGTHLHFKFNNSALFAQNIDLDDEDNFDEMFWKMGKGSMKRFFTHLEKMETKSLQLTKEVLSERKNLEAVVAGVQPLIQIGLEKLDEIKMTAAILEQNQNVIKENENFEYEVDITKSKKIDLESGRFVTNCHGCNFTCHYPCFIPKDEDKHGCSAMKNGKCTVCPGRCMWNVHHNMPFRFETEIVKEKRTYAKLKKQYEEALGKSMTIEKIIKQLEEEYCDVQEQVLELNDELARSLTRLKEIALRPDPLSTPEYIELLIESEKQSAKAGYKKRIAELEEIKKHALIVQKVERGEPLASHEKQWDLRQKIAQKICLIVLCSRGVIFCNKSSDSGALQDNHQRKTLSNNMETKIKDDNNYTKLSTGNPSVYLLNLRDTGRGALRKKDFGCSYNSTRPNKTIMLMGATGSGKSTLINGMINYILGVEWSDSLRFKLIDEQTNKTQAESQTSDVTAYQIHYQNDFQVPYSVTIIDTPGFGDTRGIAQDKEITEKIRKFFSEKYGIVSIDAVCFVVQSALARLTHTQKYIFEAILSIFGKDIANNITIMITFADGQKPPVLEAIKAADIPCGKKEDGTHLHFKFNNSALFAQNIDLDDEDNFDEMFWKMGKGSMKRFFTHLEKMETKSLQLTKEVLSERKNLEAVVAGVQPLIQIGLEKLDEIKMTRAILEQNQNVIKENENFEYEVDITKSKKIDLESGRFVTNCHGCNFTCHYPCFIPKDEDKHGCSAMKNGKCTVCPGRCMWNVHHNMPFRFETEIVKEKRTYAKLKKQYEEALGKSMTIEKIIKQLEEEYCDVQEQVLELNDELARSLTRLKEIALRPDPLSTLEYIELLIESEKQSAKAGYKKRIAELEEIKKHALIVQKVERGEPLASHEKQWDLRQKIAQKSRPGLKTTAIGAVDLQGASGNWATVGQRSRGGRRVHRQREKRKGESVGLRIGTLNVGTMTGKGRELADMMERRKVDILCVQETRWKGSKTRSIGAGFKLFYYGVDSKRNGVGVVLKEEFVRNVLEVKRVSDRVMSLKLEIEGVMLNVVNGYAPQVGCELEEKERF
ncbi:hypothetical protein QTP70_010258 [Hemibagrus guttatus]|uniref:AAA+ ATPase domain-containing protein n=1 Tax=Hemibagrus guttatus TaxID=175788 RepID=A0AAE0R1H2_9TELE|nr:hypothetical protein QTP70_010258 [Hemibagrus guttatus]